MILAEQFVRVRPFVSYAQEEDRQALAFLMVYFTSGTNAAGTLNDLSPVFNKLGIISIRPASSPHNDTGVSSDSLITNSMSRKIVGWSSRKYAVTKGIPLAQRPWCIG
jgi:hypothetical protein